MDYLGPNRRCLRRYKKEGEEVLANIHLVWFRGVEWFRAVDFRDYLITFEDTRHRYAMLKRWLAKRSANSSEYSQMKNEFIFTVMRKVLPRKTKCFQKELKTREDALRQIKAEGKKDLKTHEDALRQFKAEGKKDFKTRKDVLRQFEEEEKKGSSSQPDVKKGVEHKTILNSNWLTSLRTNDTQRVTSVDVSNCKNLTDACIDAIDAKCPNASIKF